MTIFWDVMEKPRCVFPNGDKMMEIYPLGPDGSLAKVEINGSFLGFTLW